MNFSTTSRLDDKLNGILLGVVITIVVSMGFDVARDDVAAAAAAGASQVLASLPTAPAMTAVASR
jgi:hypothetical protein